MAAVLPLSGCGSAKTTATAGSSTATTPASTATSTGTTPTTSSIPASNGASSAVLPAQFTLKPDGSLSPPVVSGPTDTTILLTVTSKASHPVRIFVSIGRYLTVPPGGRASVRLTGLKNGRYGLYVDGKMRAALVVGAQPGP